MEGNNIKEEVVKYRAYIEKPYLNSNKEEFGVTIKGKTKDFLNAHQSFKDLVIKGTCYNVDNGSIRFLDVTDTRGIFVATVQVTQKNGNKGNAELKVYAPSTNKKKGATIELRKMSDFDYSFVHALKVMIEVILDGFIDGADISEIVTNGKVNTARKSRVTSKSNLFTCELCNFQTRFGTALKTHKTKIHDLKPSATYKCTGCDFQALNESLFNQHIKEAHKNSNKRQKESISPSSSPPAKKHGGLIGEEELQEAMDMDIQIEANDFINRMLQNRIEELEKELAKLKEEKEMAKLKSGTRKISKYLAPVMTAHLPKLRGYRQRYRAKPNGACLDNCLAVHVYEDENEGPRVKKRVNKHVADNWDAYYKNIIPLPFEETVGVGPNAKVIKKSTRDEMLEFLYSDESLMVYSDSQMIHAMANLYNISIFTFTYGRGGETWNVVSPDPEMSKAVEISFGKWLPDMALYHSEDIHFDLLVRDDSRLAQMGPLAGLGQVHGMADAAEAANDGLVNSTDDESQYGKQNNSSKNQSNEVFLMEDKAENGDKDIEEEKNLFNSKQFGHKRTSSQASPGKIAKLDSIFMCDQCGSQLESQGLLDSHMNEHVSRACYTCEDCNHEFLIKADYGYHMKSVHSRTSFACKNCDDEFIFKQDFDKHMEQVHKKVNHACENCGEKFTLRENLNIHIGQVHGKSIPSGEWNCNDCPFQGNQASELLNHLKLTCHQPSKNLDKKQLFLDYKRCYTCSMEFEGWYNLMKHRKAVHPSNKKCRNFPDNCKWGKECFYVHEEPMDVDEMKWNFKCDICEDVFQERRDFMVHKKSKHRETVPNCEQFIRGECRRPESYCWFIHNEENKSNYEQVFQKVIGKQIPPDQIATIVLMLTNLTQKVENMEKTRNN